MKRLVKIISVILLVFIILSICVYRLRLNKTMVSRHRAKEATELTNDLITAEGDINSVDAVNNTLLLNDGSQTFAFSFNNRTVFRNANSVVQPAAISSGTRARVRYRKKGDRNLAQEIMVTSPQ